MDYLGFNVSKSIYDDYALGVGWKNTRILSQSLNVYQFKITEWYQRGIYLVVKINYPSSKTYEGNKVLVYEGIVIEDLQELKAIDPHFSASKENPSPIARFEANDQGWVNALKFCSMLHSERLQLEY
jgi:hypothetical protein